MVGGQVVSGRWSVVLVKLIENSAFIHTKIMYVRSSCNYIISEFGIIEIFIIAVGNYLWF